MKENIKPATGRLGVLVVGVGGAVSTTMITGTLAARKGLATIKGFFLATSRRGEAKGINRLHPMSAPKWSGVEWMMLG